MHPNRNFREEPRVAPGVGRRHEAAGGAEGPGRESCCWDRKTGNVMEKRREAKREKQAGLKFASAVEAGPQAGHRRWGSEDTLQ